MVKGWYGVREQDLSGEEIGASEIKLLPISHSPGLDHLVCNV